ncbi:MAG TPA: hypothetical protein VFN21_00515 [Acidimicrobiales bacterium]|nr:hypothetical protein [Acidimicrobiales bacterium]
MDLLLRCDHTDPPAGRLHRLPLSHEQVADDRSDPDAPQTIEFSGWLGLLRALSDVFTESVDEHASCPHP